MDGNRFDELARLIGSGVSRRLVLGVISSGLVSLIASRTPVQAGCLGPGDNCSQPSDCCAPLVCIDNLCLDQGCIPPDGACSTNTTGEDLFCCNNFECVESVCVPDVLCVNPGEPCDDLDFQCCGDLLCTDSHCVDPDNHCTPFGEPCDDTTPPCCGDQTCIQGLCSPFICGEEGFSCTVEPDGNSFDCCYWLECADGVCTWPEKECTGYDCYCCPGSWCVAEGRKCVSMECEDDGDCPTRAVGCHNGWCVDYEWWVCEVTDECDPGLECRNGFCYEPCIGAGQPCAETVGCCGELECVEGICGSVNCAVDGSDCTTDTDCCSDLVCTEGSCQVVDGPTAQPEPPSDSVDGVTTLPSTGFEDDEDGLNTIQITSLTAGSAALLAIKRFLETRNQSILIDAPATGAEQATDSNGGDDT